MATTDFAEAFHRLSERFDAIANGVYQKCAHMADEVAQRALTASELLNEAADAGLFPHYRRWRSMLDRLKYDAGTRRLHVDPMGVETIDWRDRRGAEREKWLLHVWVHEVGQLCHFHRAYFRADAGRLIENRMYIKWGTRRIPIPWLWAETELPDPNESIISTAPDISLRCVERDDYDAGDRINLARQRARTYADACGVLGRLASGEALPNEANRDLELAGGGEARRAVGNGEVSAAPQELVTLNQVAPLTGFSKRTLERYLRQGRLPEPDVPGGEGKAHRWFWHALRPALAKTSKRTLPERFPASRII